jgi:hypothetical protein
MRRSVRALLPVVLLLVTVATEMFGQHNLFVPRPTTVTYIDDVINGDTLAGGVRKDSLRVYVLQRGGTWFWENSVQNIGWKLTIQAADTGSGSMPRIYGRPTPGTTTVPYNYVIMAGPLVVKGLMICGYVDADTSMLNKYQAPGQFFSRSNPSPDRQEFYGNVFSGPLQAYVSAFGSCSVIKMVDNVFANDGVPPIWDLGNGRIIDCRNVSLDSLILVNNTLAYGFDRAIRHLKSVGRIDNFLLDHNTVYENGGRYGLFSLGAVGSKVTITNNLLIDPMAFGADTSTYRQFDFGEAGEFDAQGKVKMAWIYNMAGANDSLPGKKATVWTIAKNYWYVTPQIQAVWDSARKSGWDPAIGLGRFTTDTIRTRIADTANAFIKLSSFAFTNVPPPMTSVVIYATSPGPNGTAGQSSGGVWPGYDRRLINYYRDTMDCSYSTSSPAYTGGTLGFPAGDLNWFPSKKAAWVVATGIAENPAGSTLPELYTLSQNYPNPFNPATQIEFSIPKQSQVSLKVFNLLGQEVATLVNGVLPVGHHTATFNASNLASGVYFYRIDAGSFSSTRKMLLLK